MSKKAILYYMTVNDFFLDFLKKRAGTDYSNFEVVVISKDIITSNVFTSNYQTCYKSNYDNVSFALELFPMAGVIEYLTEGASIDDYALRYKTQLNYSDAMAALCSIADLVLNDNTDVIMLCSSIETRMSYMDILSEFIYENFNIIVNNYAENKDKDDFDPGDYDKARNYLAFQIQNQNLIDDCVGTFFNKFTKDMAEDYRKILMSKSVDELYKIAVNRKLYINRHKPKEYIVDHILKNIMDDKRFKSG